MKCSGGRIMHMTKIAEFFWMSGRCPNNFRTENGILGNMNKLGNIAWDYEIFFHGSDLHV